MDDLFGNDFNSFFKLILDFLERIHREKPESWKILYSCNTRKLLWKAFS